MKKTVLHILNSNSYSGAENVVITIINSLKKYDEQINCIYVSLDGPIANILEEHNIKFEAIKRLGILQIRQLVKKYNPDIIHAHDFTASMMCVISGINRPIISHLHNNSPWIKKYGIKSISFLATCPFYKKILTVSDSIIKEYVFGKYIKNKTETINNPIDISVVQEKVKNDKVQTNKYDIAFIGRLTEQKDPKRFIRIVKKLTQNNKNVKTVMIGDGILKNECIQLVKKENLENNIDIRGFLSNPHSVLAESKILCVTSLWEGYGLVAVEALSLSKPVVATAVGGLISIVDKKCGKLCSEDDEFLIELTKLINDENYYNGKAENALRKAKEINNIDYYIRKLCYIYSS